ncbi:thioredoxin-like domain-containing protein [Flavobacterium buctense]|uniref:Thioredoxin-like domain-containing protein n=1 Tax=Flavobacterium buctense TaxID=1648146 RepID=A0ABU9DYT1_9FLAO|nr:thioredoxin-like domain-containing protein [Flavobacterium buctense]
MHSYRNLKVFALLFPLLTLLSSCKNEFKGSDYVAYFGGEIVNPNSQYVLFCKDNEVIDSIKLDKNNRFFVQFDSLAPGLYTFKHEPEYQYVYFDKNDSLMVRVNTRDFDNSVVFCGRGDQKNNFLMEQYLKNEKDRNKIFETFDYDIEKFNKAIDSSYQIATKFYAAKKEEIKWSDDFDEYAKAAIDFPYYSRKELYPMIHKMRTGNDVYEKIPADYYDFRKKIDCNNVALSNYSPFVMYLSHMLNNMGAINYHNHFSEVDLALKTNINKMNIADTLIKNEKVKNTILNNIAFTYLLEDQNMVNNQSFLATYHKISTDKSQKNEITKIGDAIQLLKAGGKLPEVMLIDRQGNKISSTSFANRKTVIFFWTSNALSHLEAVHKKILGFQKDHPDYQFIGININDTQEQWKNVLKKYKFDQIIEYRCTDFEDIKAKWVITKIHRTMILDHNGAIKNAFTNIFELNFEEELK